MLFAWNLKLKSLSIIVHQEDVQIKFKNSFSLIFENGSQSLDTFRKRRYETECRSEHFNFTVKGGLHSTQQSGIELSIKTQRCDHSNKSSRWLHSDKLCVPIAWSPKSKNIEKFIKRTVWKIIEQFGLSELASNNHLSLIGTKSDFVKEKRQSPHIVTSRQLCCHWLLNRWRGIVF